MTSSGWAPVTAIVPTRNDAEYLAGALRSIARQTVLPAQVIVVDDGSEPGAAALVAQAVAQQAALAIELVRTEHAGLSAARNAGLARASQQFVAFLDADDRWMPDHLERKLGRLAARDDRYSTSYDGYLNADPAGRLRWTMAFGEHDGPIEGRLLGQPLGIPAGMPFHLHRRAALEAVGGCEESLAMGEDFDLLLRLGRAGQLITGTGRPTVWRSLRPGSMTNRDPRRTLRDVDAFIAKAERERLLDARSVRKMRRGVRVHVARELMARGDHQSALALIADSFRIERPQGAGQWLLHAAVRLGEGRGAAHAVRLAAVLRAIRQRAAEVRLRRRYPAPDAEMSSSHSAT